MIATATPTLRWQNVQVKLLPVATLLVGALLTSVFLPAWGFMWLLATATFLSVKWLTLVQYIAGRNPLAIGLVIAYLCGWPGMDANSFLSRSAAKPNRREWWFAAAKLVIGGLLLWGVARLALPRQTLLAGWIGMGSLLFMLHFGLFHILSLTWRAAGFDARPLMNAPILASSVSDFWSRRWNMAFRDAAYQLVFRPRSRRAGGLVAALAVFAVSGIVHDLVISCPAGAGFGLPTLYFGIQAVGFLLERRHPALRRGWPGRCLAIAVVLGPLPLLFHTPFMKAVVLPMLSAFGRCSRFSGLDVAKEKLMNVLATLLVIGGILHLGTLWAGALVPRVLDFRGQLREATPLFRQLVWVYALYIFLTILGFGLVSIVFADLLAGGTPLARAVCGFIALFWIVRLLIQLFVYDAKPYLAGWPLKLGYHGLTIVFSYHAAVYSMAALLPG